MKELQPTSFEPEWFSPVIIKPPQNLTAELGVNVTLTCAAKGHPKPTIRYIELNREFFFGLCLYSKNSTVFYHYSRERVLALIHSKPSLGLRDGGWGRGGNKRVKKGQCCLFLHLHNIHVSVTPVNQIYKKKFKKNYKNNKNKKIKIYRAEEYPKLRKTEARLFYMCYIHDCINSHIENSSWMRGVHPSPFNINFISPFLGMRLPVNLKLIRVYCTCVCNQ